MNVKEMLMLTTDPSRGFRRLASAALIGLALFTSPLVHAESAASELSAVSLLPVAMSIAAPVMIISDGARLTVVAVQASADGTLYVLERASDGARASLRFVGRAGGALSVGIGTAVVVTTISAGEVLSAAGQVIAFVPNQIGAALLYNERITW
jgi:hypothetical protein